METRDAFVERCSDWMHARLHSASPWRCWVAADGNTLVGCVWIQLVEKLPNPNGLAAHNAYLSNFVVDEKHRGTGVGSLLLDAALSWCGTADVDTVFLWPTERSRTIYARYGFTTRGGIMERAVR